MKREVRGYQREAPVRKIRAAPVDRDASEAREHLLLTVLGIEPSATRYTLKNQEKEAVLAPVALFELLPPRERPDRVLALCTPAAKLESWPLLEETLASRCQVELIDIPAGDKQEDVNTFLATVTGTVETDVDLTVDVTHGFRHFSFLTYVAVLYLAALRGVRVRGAYYGMRNRDAPSPFLDLRPLLKLPRWIHALEVLRETGSSSPMAQALNDGLVNSKAKKTAGNLSRLLSRMSEAYLSGLPLELGREACDLRDHRLKPLKRVLDREHHLPLFDELVDRLDTIVEPFALIERVSGDGWKRNVQLSRKELERQAGLIDDLLRRENLATALGLMREWTVSWVVWARGADRDWLDYWKVRKKAENRLNAIRDIVTKAPDLCGELTEQQCFLGKFWDGLTELRNGYAHHGLRPQGLVGDKKTAGTLCRVRRYWEETLKSLPSFPLSLGRSTGSRVLVSPVGLRPGVLFSALQACRTGEDRGEPTLCLIICSRQTEGMIAEALECAGYIGEVDALLLKDAFGGSDEIRRMVKSARRHFIGASQVLVNVTGGTTLMGLAAEELATVARSLACPVRRFGLIDRRPPRQQEIDPYRAGEPFWFGQDER